MWLFAFKQTGWPICWPCEADEQVLGAERNGSSLSPTAQLLICWLIEGFACEPLCELLVEKRYTNSLQLIDILHVREPPEAFEA